MYCTKCGSENIDNEVFCKKCGTPSKNDTPNVNESFETDTHVKNKPKKSFWSVLGKILGVLLAMQGISYILGGPFIVGIVLLVVAIFLLKL